MPGKLNPSAKDFPIVCVGGSAGGYSAYVQLLKHLSPEMGAAIVIVNHMRSTPTKLHETLSHYTKMPVVLISEKLRVRRNRVFIIPSNRDLHVLDGEFRLKPLSKSKGWSDVITLFLFSLARNWDGKLVAVIVSGLDADGAEALSRIKEVDGITIAQTPDT